MLDLLYARRSAAKQSVKHLENLVAILTQQDGPQILHIYNTPHPPPSEDDLIIIASLREFPTMDLSLFDGVLIGFSVLDLLRPDLVTKGPLFYPLERVFIERDELPALYLTLGNLSIELMRRLKEIDDQQPTAIRISKEAKAFQIALPSMLQDRECAGLAAVLPVGELNRFVIRKNCHFIYYEPQTDQIPLDPALLNTDTHWVVGFEELALLHPEIRRDSPRFLDLRAILRGMDNENALQSTRKQLAGFYYRSAMRQERFLPVAWALAVEYWLAQLECEDLVVLCPHEDFTCFLETGESLRIYRTAEEINQPSQPLPGNNTSLGEIIRTGFPQPYARVVFSLPEILHFIDLPAGILSLDLSSVLFKAGYEKRLSRSLWLLSRDLIQNTFGLVDRSIPVLKSILDSSIRACIAFNISDPWEWRQGRWRLYLEGTYQTCQQVLERLALSTGKPMSAYFEALARWLGCSSAENTENSIQSVLEKLRDFQRELRGSFPPGPQFAEDIAHSDQLSTICQGLLNLSNPASTPEHIEKNRLAPLVRENIPSVLRRSTDFSELLPLISPFFKRSWDFLQEARRNRQFIYSQEQDINRLISLLQQLVSTLNSELHLLYAPLHELKILEFAYHQEIQNVKDLLHELETSAKLTVHLKNAWADIYQPVRLALEIINRGRVEAESLEVNIDQRKGFQLLDPSPIREIPVLRPGEPNRIEYQILPENEDVELQIVYSFRDRSGQRHKDAWTTHLNVRSLDTQPYQIKVNRYQFGRPIQKMNEFYGRRGELQNILSLLKAGGKQNLLLRGPRRMGKTSLLYMMRETITNRAARRFFEIPPDWDDELDLVKPIFLSLHSFNLLTGNAAVKQFFHTLLERVATSLETPEERQDLILGEYKQKADEVGAVNAALEQIGEILNAHPNQRIAVLLDEYDEVYRPGTGNLDRHLREFVSAEQRLTWIIASTLALFHEVKTISSPWFNVFMIIELSRLSEESAIELVEGPTRGEHIFWRSDAVLALLDETGRHPAFTQLFCGKVIAYLNQMKTNYVLYDTVVSVAEQIVDEQETANNHFEFFWQDTRGTGQLILLILDSHEMPLKRDEIRQRIRRKFEQKFGNIPRRLVQDDGDTIEWQEQEFKSQIDWVEKITNAVSVDSQKRYTFTVPLFRRWLRRRRQYQDLEAEAMDNIAREIENDGPFQD